MTFVKIIDSTNTHRTYAFNYCKRHQPRFKAHFKGPTIFKKDDNRYTCLHFAQILNKLTCFYIINIKSRTHSNQTEFNFHLFKYKKMLKDNL